jgi:NADH:ubiquinone oxidoreductase subunit 6 (subunit J)
MWIVAIAWLYVALMMALAESQHPQGGWLGAVFTFLFYGLAPLALVMYLLNTPARRRRKHDKLAHQQHTSSIDSLQATAPSPANKETPQANVGDDH